jgi:hypothetical protein
MAGQRAADSAHMAASGTGSTTTGATGAMAGGTATPTKVPDHKTGGAMGGDSAGMGGTHNDTTKKKP